MQRGASVDSIALEDAAEGGAGTAHLLGAANRVAPVDPRQLPQMKKWRVASRTVTMFSRRAAAGLMNAEEPLDHEEEAAIAELTQHG